MFTTLNQVRAKSPCSEGWAKLLAHLGKTKADDEPLSIIAVLDSNGLDDALWCLRAVTGHDKELRLYAAWCARQVQHLMADPRSVYALGVAERFANGVATDEELAAASAAAWDASVAAWVASAAAWAASDASDASAAAADAADAARNAAADAAWAAASSAAAAARAAAVDTARAAAGDAQEKQLREVCEAIDKETK